MSLLRHPSNVLPVLQAHEASVTMRVGGVLLHIDMAEEDAYLETTPGFSMDALRAAEVIGLRNGFEVMGEDEGGVVEYEDGRVRHYLAQTIFFDNNEIKMKGEVVIAS